MKTGLCTVMVESDETKNQVGFSVAHVLLQVVKINHLKCVGEAIGKGLEIVVLLHVLPTQAWLDDP